MDLINNTNDINTYTNYNKIYIPNDYLNNNFNYYFNGDYITIITNNNCFTQYNSTYCNCYLYNYKNNVISDAYSCNTNSNLPKINFSYITNDINYSSFISSRFYSDKSLLLFIFILGVILACFFKRR